MTSRQAQLLAYLRAREQAGELCPTMQEIADYMGIASKGRVFEIVDSLERRGEIRRVKGLARSIKIVDAEYQRGVRDGRALGIAETQAAAQRGAA